MVGKRGIDEAGEEWANNHGIPVKPFAADWNKYGNAAGPTRNKAMADHAEALIAIPHPTLESKGTWNMIEQAVNQGLKVHIHRLQA